MTPSVMVPISHAIWLQQMKNLLDPACSCRHTWTVHVRKNKEVSGQAAAVRECAAFSCGLFLCCYKKQISGSKLMLQHGAGSIGLQEGKTAWLVAWVGVSVGGFGSSGLWRRHYVVKLYMTKTSNPSPVLPPGILCGVLNCVNYIT